MPRLAPDLQHHGAQRIAGERIGRRPQRTFDIGGAHRHQIARIKAELGKPSYRERARFEIAKILPHPHQRPSRRDARRKPRDKTGRRRALMPQRKHFVHGGGREPAAQRAICLGMAERDAMRGATARGCLHALDMPAQ